MLTFYNREHVCELTYLALVGCSSSVSTRRLAYLNVCTFDGTSVAGIGTVGSIIRLTTPVGCL